MRTSKKIYEHYTSNIRLAKTVEDKENAVELWNKVYDGLPEKEKTEVKTILKQRVNALLESQMDLDSRIVAAGLPSFEGCPVLV